MSIFWNKLDKELQIIFCNYLEIQEKGEENIDWVHPAIKTAYKLSLYLEFSGNLNEIEQLGFNTTWKESETEVLGDVDARDLEEITECAGFEYLRFGSEQRMHLSTSTGEINVRGSGKVWDIDQATGKFCDSTGDGTIITGEGVVIGIIDSGIDFNHPVFLKPILLTKRPESEEFGALESALTDRQKHLIRPE